MQVLLPCDWNQASDVSSDFLLDARVSKFQGSLVHICIFAKLLQGRDLSEVTDSLWKRFYERHFGEESLNLVSKRMKDNKVVFKWRLLYEVCFLSFLHSSWFIIIICLLCILHSLYNPSCSLYNLVLTVKRVMWLGSVEMYSALIFGPLIYRQNWRRGITFRRNQLSDWRDSLQQRMLVSYWRTSFLIILFLVCFCIAGMNLLTRAFFKYGF